MIVILRDELRDEFRRLGYHRHDGRDTQASSCTADMKHIHDSRILPPFQQGLLREVGKDFLSLLRVSGIKCFPDSWYNFITYPDPVRNDAVDQMVADYNYAKGHNGNIFRPEVPPLAQAAGASASAAGGAVDAQPEQPEQPIGRMGRIVNFLSTKASSVSNFISGFFGRRQQAAPVQAVYRPHEHPLNKRRVIPAVNFEHRMECDSCKLVNQPGYIGCEVGCNYQECLECAIKHGHITQEEATEQLDRVYDYVQPERAAVGAIFQRAEQQRADVEQQLQRDLDMARHLQEEENQPEQRPRPVALWDIPPCPLCGQLRCRCAGGPVQRRPDGAGGYGGAMGGVARPVQRPAAVAVPPQRRVPDVRAGGGGAGYQGDRYDGGVARRRDDRPPIRAAWLGDPDAVPLRRVQEYQAPTWADAEPLRRVPDVRLGGPRAGARHQDDRQPRAGARHQDDRQPRAGARHGGVPDYFGRVAPPAPPRAGGAAGGYQQQAPAQDFGAFARAAQAAPPFPGGFGGAAPGGGIRGGAPGGGIRGGGFAGDVAPGARFVGGFGTLCNGCQQNINNCRCPPGARKQNY